MGAAQPWKMGSKGVFLRASIFLYLKGMQHGFCERGAGGAWAQCSWEFGTEPRDVLYHPVLWADQSRKLVFPPPPKNGHQKANGNPHPPSLPGEGEVGRNQGDGGDEGPTKLSQDRFSAIRYHT